MTTAGASPTRVLELRSVRGAGGGRDKAILLGTARTDRDRYAVTVCYLRDKKDPIFYIDLLAGSLPIDYVEIRERHSFDPGTWRHLRALVRLRRIDIVHAHDHKCNLLALLLAGAERVVPLATAHGWAGHTWQERRLYYPGDRRLLASFPRVIAASSEIKQALVAAGAKPGRVTVVLNGIDPEAFRRVRAREAEARARFGFAPTDVAIGAIGRLEPHKNFPLLIRVFRHVADRFPRARLVIAGDGSRRQELDALIAKERLGDRCRLLGHVADIGGLHHGLDLCVQSSDYAGTPHVVLEAMALETPLVATNVGGTAELVRDGEEALVVPPRDEAALAAAIQQVLSDAAASRARADAARRRVECELSLAKQMQKVEAIYDELAVLRWSIVDA